MCGFLSIYAMWSFLSILRSLFVRIYKIPKCTPSLRKSTRVTPKSEKTEKTHRPHFQAPSFKTSRLLGFRFTDTSLFKRFARISKWYTAALKRRG